MMLGVAAYILMMQVSWSVVADARTLGATQPTLPGTVDGLDEASIHASIVALNEQLKLAKAELDQYEQPFGGPGSNMPISSYDPAMFPILIVPGTNCSNMPIYAWRPLETPSARRLDASTFVPLRSIDP